MLGTKEALQMAVKRADDVDTIRLLQRGQTETGTCRELLEDYSRSLTSVHIKHDIDSDLHILNENSHLSLGKIVKERKPQTLPKSIGVVKTLSSCRATKLRSINIGNIHRSGNVSKKQLARSRRNSLDLSNNSHGVQRVVLLSNVLVVGFTDQSYLQLLTVDGQCLNQLQTQGVPQDMCAVDATTVALSLCNTIQLVRVQNCRLTPLHIIQTTCCCHGIAYVNGNFMVSTPRGISMVNRDGNAREVHSLEKNCYSIAYDSLYQQAFATLSDHQKVNTSCTCTSKSQGFRGINWSSDEEHYVTDDSGGEANYYVRTNKNAYPCGRNVNTRPKSSQQKLKKRSVSSRQNTPVLIGMTEQVLNTSCGAVHMKISPARGRGTKLIPKTILNEGVVKNATGVAVDREGNVYICGQESNNVVQISTDGSKVREFLTSEDGINSPTAIAVCGDKLVVTSLSPQQQDVIHVFQLN
ncbi:uncharacterized protein [Argopecten irradians]|uniref:uncharacterized protein n=1 Tax=Argopecten irradians TaxID=31199 RepID=UPI0037184941